MGLKDNYEVYKEPDSDSDVEIETVLISIDIPDSKIDEVATETEIDGIMTFNLCNFFIKSKFDTNFHHFYNKFTATSRDIIVFDFLSEEIDFTYYTKTDVIKDY